MAHWLVMLAVVLAFWTAADAGAQPRAQKAQKAEPQKGQAQKKAAPAPEVPLHLYLAKGEPNACGEGCSEWIAVEGSFDSGAAGRAQAFLRRHGARKLPVYFHSPGGSGNAAIAIGRQLRQLGLTTGVAKTVPRGCASTSDQSDACRTAKRSPQPVAAEWRPDANCSSACVWAVIGGKARHVPAAARLGVHSPKFTVTRTFSDGRVQQLSAKQFSSFHRTKAAEHIALTRSYIRDMGIDGGLLETALKVPHESIHYLSRDQIAALGIDRREYTETHWFIAQTSSSTTLLSKWFVEARGADRKDYRLSIVLLSCSQPQRATIRYWRGLASDELGRRVNAIFSIGKHKARLSWTGNGTRLDALDNGAVFASSSDTVPFDELEAAAAHGAIGVIETDQIAVAARPRVIELGTQGLAEGIKVLRDKCTASAQPAPGWVDGTQAPWVPAQTAPQSFPSTPYGAFPAPELGLEKRNKTAK